MFQDEEDPVTPSDFRALGKAGGGDSDYQRQPLWLIPIYLRSRLQYYREHDQAIDRANPSDLAARNLRHFQGLGLALVDPWGE